MASLFDTVQQFFANEGWTTAEMANQETTLEMRYQSKSYGWNCFARVHEEYGQVVFYSVVSGSVPGNRRAEVAALFTRINFDTVIGHFELGLDTGEARFKTSMDVGPDGLDGVPFPRLFGRLVGTNLDRFETYLPAVYRVIGGDTATDALATIDP